LAVSIVAWTLWREVRQRQLRVDEQD